MALQSPSWKRSILTEIYLCHACPYHEIEDGNARTRTRLERSVHRGRRWQEAAAAGGSGSKRLKRTHVPDDDDDGLDVEDDDDDEELDEDMHGLPQTSSLWAMARR